MTSLALSTSAAASGSSSNALSELNSLELSLSLELTPKIGMILTQSESEFISAFKSYSSRSVWFHRINDGCDTINAIRILQNLEVNLILAFKITVPSESIGVGTYILHKCNVPARLSCFCKDKALLPYFEVANKTKLNSICIEFHLY